MSEFTSRQQIYEDLVRRLGALLRGAQLYSPGHPLTARTTAAVLETLRQIHTDSGSIAIGFVGHEIVVGGIPLPRTRENMGELIKRLHAHGIERITIDRGVEADELVTFMQLVGRSGPQSNGEAGPDGQDGANEINLPHIRAGRIRAESRSDGPMPATTSLRQMYEQAVATAEVVWESAKTEGKPELPTARATVDGLAESVTHNRTALLGLAAMKEYDNYTFTHMVNVSILTMAQARALGIEGRLLRELGLSALMHDIGKTRTPLEILNKPESLTDQEFAIMKRHTIDGAEILRRTPEIPTLAPVVALEHHMRLDGQGYPEQISRESLNLGTMLCGIADVYDAMRSLRKYQGAFPTDRILEVLRRNDGRQFDQHLVRRFVQLLGIYPPGNLVRLNTGEVAVVVQANASDPYRPRVRLVFNAAGERMTVSEPLDLWHPRPDSGELASIVSPVDPADYAIDPQALL